MEPLTSMLFNNNKSDPIEELLKWKHPITCIVSGPSGSGKTSFVLKIIKDADVLLTNVPEIISWHYGEFQKWMLDKEFKGINFCKGLPDIQNFEPSKNNLLIIDDLMHETDETIGKLFTKGSHHKYISVILLTQNIFHQSKHSRTINLNTHYMVILKNVRDASQITNLGKQMYPGSVNNLRASYKDATSNPDLQPNTPDSLR